MQPGKAFRGESGDFSINQTRVLRQRIANAKIRVANQSHDVAWISFIHRFALAPEKLMRAGEPDLLASARVVDRHITLETTRANPHEGKPIAVLRVHVGLNFKNKP